MTQLNNKYILRALWGGLLLFLSMSSYAQSVVKGTVTDKATGEPLPGTTVVIQGTPTGVTTDIDGKFSLNTKSDDKLVFSFIGYKNQIVAVEGKTELNVALEPDNRQLDEVVVVGQGTMKKSNLTGAVDQVKAADVLENRPVKNVAAGLQGQIAGLNITTGTSGGDPAGEMNINIRGVTSITMDDDGKKKINTESPLIVIDGVPGGNMNDVNPSDIETISVLKDASSAAIYGSRAPNGVVIITTKQGGFDKPARVTANYSMKMAQPINMPELVSSVIYARLQNEAAINGTGSPIYNDTYIEELQKHIDDPVNNASMRPKKDDPTVWQGDEYANTDWYAELIRKVSVSHQFSANLSGGSKKVAYYFGVGYNNNAGILKFANDKFEQYNFSANINTNLTDWANLRFIANYTRKLDDRPHVGAYSRANGNWFHNIARSNPTKAVMDPNGYLRGEAAELEQGGRKKDRKDIGQYTAEATFKLVKGLELSGGVSYRSSGREYVENRNVVYNYDATGKQIANTSDNWVGKIDAFTDYYSTNIKFNYNASFDGHNIGAVAGWQMEYERLRELNTNRYGLISESNPSLSLSYGSKYGLSDKIDAWAVSGYFARFTYNFKERYLLEFNGRYDGSSRYLKKDRWNFFPSVSAGYMISRESFWTNSAIANVLHTLKVRGSWGRLGALANQNIYDILNTRLSDKNTWFFTGTSPQLAIELPNAMASSNLTWAKPTTLDFGVEIGMLDNRLTGVFDWFQKTVYDQVGPAMLYPGILGINPPASNNTETRTSGVELTLNWNDQIGDFKYGLRGIFSDSKAKVISYDNPNQSLARWVEGRAIGEIWGYETDRMILTDNDISHMPDQSALYAKWNKGDMMYTDLNRDGVIDEGQNTARDPGDLKVIGNSMPRYEYGLNIDLEYKGISLGMFWQGVGKKDWAPNSPFFWGSANNRYQHTFFANHWTDIWRSDNPTGTLPKIYSTGEGGKNQKAQTAFLQDASYLRLKNVTLGYTLPKRWMDKIYVKKFMVYASVENALTFTKLFSDYIDPELVLGDAKLYPMQRVYSFGVNIAF